MLAKQWRLRVINNTDQTLTYNDGARIETRCLPWKISSGGLEYETVIVDDTVYLDTDASIQAGVEVESGVQDNNSILCFGVKGTFLVTADLASTVGTMELYLEENDDGTHWPSDQGDFEISDLRLVAVLPMDTEAVDEARAVNFEF